MRCVLITYVGVQFKKNFGNHIGNLRRVHQEGKAESIYVDKARIILF